MCGTVTFVVAIRVMFGAIFHHVGGAWSTVAMLLSLIFMTTDPTEAYGHEFNVVGDDGVVHEPSSCGAVGLNGQLQLRPTHPGESVA